MKLIKGRFGNSILPYLGGCVKLRIDKHMQLHITDAQRINISGAEPDTLMFTCQETEELAIFLIPLLGTIDPNEINRQLESMYGETKLKGVRVFHNMPWKY
jgi:hypothetical protein